MQKKEKKKYINSSARLNNKMKGILFDPKLKYTKTYFNKINDYNILDKNKFKEIKKYKGKTKNKNNKIDNTPDINLIVDNKKEEIKFIDEKEYEKLKLKNKNIKSCRDINHLNLLNKLNPRRVFYKKNVDLFNNNQDNYVGSPRSIWFYINNKIMPPNEI